MFVFDYKKQYLCHHVLRLTFRYFLIKILWQITVFNLSFEFFKAVEYSKFLSSSDIEEPIGSNLMY